jgi:hypothetical protein
MVELQVKVVALVLMEEMVVLVLQAEAVVVEAVKMFLTTKVQVLVETVVLVE